MNSGNGVHLYWLLDTPYLIDDAGDPPPVQTEWIEGAGGRKKPRKYFVENGDKVYLDQRRQLRVSAPRPNIFRMFWPESPRPLAAITPPIYRRLLRVPGTLNRKDQRNGREPVPTALIECDPTRQIPA